MSGSKRSFFGKSLNPYHFTANSKITQNRKLTKKCSYLNVASGTSQWARYQEASLDVEELVLQLLSLPGCQQDHCLNLSLSICPHHLHHQLVGLQLVITCALPAMVSVPFSTPPSLCQFCVSLSLRYFHSYVENAIRDGGSTALYTRTQCKIEFTYASHCVSRNLTSRTMLKTSF